MQGRIALSVVLVLGVVVLLYSVNIGLMIGSEWLGSNASFQWHMNNYFVLDAKYAYTLFGLATLAIGGAAAGLAMSSFFTFQKSTKHILVLAAAFLVAIFMTGLGFNTLDFMLGSFYWTNMNYPPPVQVPFFGSVDVWNFYFFFFVAPLWAGGLMLGLATSYFAFVYQPSRAVAAYVAKKNLAGMLNQTAQPKKYIAESTVMPRSRRLETFDNTN
jgi:hypothetical protein